LIGLRPVTLPTVAAPAPPVASEMHREPGFTAAPVD
jgi:hypothetical protein